MSRILISVNPEYVEKILSNTKKYEYRRMLAREKVDSIIIYSTWPVMKIVGEVEVVGTLSMAPSRLWERTKDRAGISRKKYREYFKGQKKANAYILGRVIEHKKHKDLTDIGIEKAPQSFIYLSSEQYEQITKG